MKIAIIGAGFSGMAVAWHLLEAFKAQITFFDSAGIGGGASGIAAGLLHPYAGLHCKLNWNGLEGYEAAYNLLTAAAHVHPAPVFCKSGLIRIALDEANLKDYAFCAASHPMVKMLSTDEVLKLVPGAVSRPGIYIESALTVYSEAYLQSLWKLCLKKESRLELAAICSLEDLSEFDLIVVSAGAATLNIKELSHLPLSIVKGQLLEVEWPEQLPIPSAPVNSQAYIVMNLDKRSCIIGATYERTVANDKPNLQKAIHEIIPKAAAMIPALKEAKIFNCRSALRASTPDHKPYLKKINSKCWVLAGMGSKGLLYHAYYANKLVQEIIASP